MATRRPMERHVVVQEHEARDVQLHSRMAPWLPDASTQFPVTTLCTCTCGTQTPRPVWPCALDAVVLSVKSSRGSQREFAC
ncbi:hypothetical protein H257_06013 [Aphanomyces astaci]|uniref:Uncharacterized protein n=1 Tax=Aphanomyces astaci TaxID=112090 RepID=W4GP78_APHAT|nr:hypothetical protein H257_06013 [Aphanomyces astaci]ETV81517.1 hypothetical protein H257_06013 [Aphanomyces astaci]|eukprot:XP_009829375.1 hypothetical protein H257_06013 [Aphanomyces astaci]